MDLEKIQAYRDNQKQADTDAKTQANHDELAGSLNNLLMATMVSKDPKMVEVAQNLASLLQQIGLASDQFAGSSLHLLPLANQELADSIRDLTDKVEQHSTTDLAPLLENLTNQVSRAVNVKPVVNVPKQSVAVDTKPLVSAINEMKKAIKDNKVDIPETDLTKVVEGLKAVQKTISGLRFPVANYVLPFRNSSGEAVQVTIGADGTLPITGISSSPGFAFANISSGTTDGAIVSAVAGKRIRVVAFRTMVGATATTVTFNTKPGGAGTAISETFQCASNGGISASFSPVGHFQTSVGQGLTATTGSGSTAGIGIVYIEV